MATLPVKGADTATYQVALLSLGSTPASGALSVIPSPDGTHAKTADITALSSAITGALAATQTVALTGTAAVTQSGAWTVGLSPGATVALAGGNTVAIKVDGSAVAQPVTVTALPLPSGAATQTTLEAVRAAVAGTLTVQGNVTVSDGAGPLTVDGAVSVSNFPATQAVSGPVTDAQLRATPIPTTAPADQDPIFDHTNGMKTSVTASAIILTPPAGCKYARISTDVDIFVNTAGIATVVDDGTAIRILANSPEVIPVVAGVAVKALSPSGTAIVRVTPMKVR